MNGFQKLNFDENVDHLDDVELGPNKFTKFDAIGFDAPWYGLQDKTSSAKVGFKRKWMNRCSRSFVMQCGPMMMWITFGAIIGAWIAQQGNLTLTAGAISVELNELICDVDISRPDTSLCYSHEATKEKSFFEQVSNASLNFLVIGDWGRNGHCCQRDVAVEMSRVENIDFIVNVGDNFYENGLTSVDSRQVEDSWSGFYGQGSQKLLTTPWYSVLGNHDYRSTPENQFLLNKKYPSWKMTERYYYKEFENAIFVFIDTSPIMKEYRQGEDDLVLDHLKRDIEEDRREIEAFLDDTLTQFSQKRWKIVVGHHPIFTVGDHYAIQDPDHYMYDHLGALFEKHHIDAYFSGHDHNLQHIQKRGVDYFISGAGSKIRPIAVAKNEFSSLDMEKSALPLFHYGSQGFAAVSVNDNDMLVQFINLRGTWLYTKVISKTIRI